jgi:hypothetical protein
MQCSAIYRETEQRARDNALDLIFVGTRFDSWPGHQIS